MDKKEKIALIDADSIPYICSKENIIESIANIDSIITNICNTLNVNKFILCLSKPPYFRLRYNLDYKGNRTGISNLKWLKTLKTYLKEAYQCTEYLGLEADDYCAWLKFENPDDYIVCSIDKDVLNQIVGSNYNYKKREWVETTAEQAYYFLSLQSLIGDSVDNIPNIKRGYGEKTAEKYLNSIEDKKYTSAVIKKYEELSTLEHYKNVLGQVRLLKCDSLFIEEGFDITSIKNSIKVNELVLDGNDRDSW